jgi:hypothetical protein
MSTPQDSLDERITDLEETLKEIRAELRPDRNGRFGFRPPTPGEMLRLTREYAIPAAITTLEAQIRALELLAELLRAVDIGDKQTRSGSSATDRAVDVGRTTLRGVRESLNRLEREMSSGGLPDDPAARDLLAEARGLQEDIDARLASLGDVDSADSQESAVRGGREGVQIDVESELETIKDQVDGEDEDDDADDVK